MSSSLFACSTKLPLASSKNQVSYFDGLEAGRLAPRRTMSPPSMERITSSASTGLWAIASIVAGRPATEVGVRVLAAVAEKDGRVTPASNDQIARFLWKPMTLIPLSPSLT